MKESFVESVTAHHQPAAHRVKSIQRLPQPQAQPGKPGYCPARADVAHIEMRVAGTGEKPREAISPRTDVVEERERHGSSFERKSPKMRYCRCVEAATQFNGGYIL